MKFMIDGGSTAPLPKARKWLIKYPEASRDLLELLKEKVVEYLVEQVRAGAQVRNLRMYELQHEISNNVVCAMRKASDLRCLIRAFAGRLNIL